MSICPGLKAVLKLELAQIDGLRYPPPRID